MDYRQLEARARKAWSVADVWHSVHREIYRFTMPARYSVDSSRNGLPPREYGEIYDATSVQAIDDFASFVTEALYPFDAKWFRFVPRRDIPDDKRQDLIQLGEDLTTRVQYLFDTSNFHPAVFVVNKDLSVGTKILRADRDPTNPNRVWFTPIPPNSAAIEDDAYGKLCAVHTKVRASAANLYARYRGGNFPQRFLEIYNTNPTTEVDFNECVLFDPDRNRWKFYVYMGSNVSGTVTEDFVTEAEYLTCPYIVTRWSKTPGLSWGEGPTYKSFADIRAANKVVELILRNASISATGIWQADDDGVLNPANIKLVPGAIIPKAQGSNGLQPLQAPGNFDVSQLVLTDLRANIKASHFTRQLPEREMTAFEAQERVRQQQRQLRGVFGQLMAEDVRPTVMRVIDLGRQMGMIPANKYEDLMDLELIGPLAQAVRESEANKLISFVGQIAAIYGPEIAFASTKPEQIIPDIAENLGVSRMYVKDKDELEVMRGNIESAAGQAIGQQLGQPGAVNPQATGVK